MNDDYICPFCNEVKGVNQGVSIYSEVVWIDVKCENCGKEWRSIFHYIGISPPCKDLHGFDQMAEIIYLLKRSLKNLKRKTKEAPKEYRKYKRNNLEVEKNEP